VEEEGGERERGEGERARAGRREWAREGGQTVREGRREERDGLPGM